MLEAKLWALLNETKILARKCGTQRALTLTFYLVNQGNCEAA